MSTIINTRSPYYIKKSLASAVSVVFQLKIYSGDKTTAIPGTVTYELVKNTTTPATGDPYAVFEISELN